jgi:hypothetical protein|nr:MAG TPA: CMP/hydroxymethyl CMP hydrolase [Caudoviricetes sp.]
MEENNKKKCFIITPIGSASSSIRRKVDGLIDEVIEPVMNELGYDVEVSHRISESGTMTAAIIQRVYNSELVIANLTGNNPNVMYEVALRHASAKPIIHITENVAELPFDVNDQRTIQYADDMFGAKELKETLKKMVESIDFRTPSNNPVTDALGKRDVVNVPQEQKVDLADMLSEIMSELNEVKMEIRQSSTKLNGTGKNTINRTKTFDHELYNELLRMCDRHDTDIMMEKAISDRLKENLK